MSAPSDGDERPYRGYSEYDLYQQIQRARADYEAADRERDQIISAYNGSSGVLEDDEYKSATARRLRIDYAISDMEAELETRRFEPR